MALQSVTAIASITLQQDSATVTFSGIPDFYRDLVIVADWRGTTGNGLAGLQLNGDTGTSYPEQNLYAEGTARGGSSSTNRTYIMQSSSNLNTSWDIVTTTIFDYSKTDKHKTILSRYSTRGTAIVSAGVARWTSLNKVTSLTFFHTGTNVFGSGSTVSLYGRIA